MFQNPFKVKLRVTLLQRHAIIVLAAMAVHQHHLLKRLLHFHHTCCCVYTGLHLGLVLVLYLLIPHC